MPLEYRSAEMQARGRADVVCVSEWRADSSDVYISLNKLSSR